MPLETLAARHQITVLTETITVGASGGAARTYASSGRVLTCTVAPQGASRRPLLGREGAVITHIVYFLADPLLNETNRLLWQGLTLRLDGLPVNIGGLGRLWRADCTLMREDNITANLSRTYT